MNKKTKILMLFSLFLYTVFIGSKVIAAPIITKVTQVDRDLYAVYANPNGSTIYSYVVGKSKEHANEYLTESSWTYITVPNGKNTIWVKSASGEYSEPKEIYVTGSCDNTETLTDRTDTGYYSRCYIKYNGSEGKIQATTSAAGATCAPGYNMDAAYSTISFNDCDKDVSHSGLDFRYCLKKFAYKCVKAGNGNVSGGQSGGSSQATGNAKLSSLSISTGSLTPNFSSSTYNYSATTDANSVTINASLMNGSASFINGYGPRTVNLNYGNNDIQIRTQDGNTTNTYTIKIKRSDGRSSNNNLNSLSVSNGTLDPSFSALTTSYNVKVDSDADTVDISADLADSSSSFVEGYGPRTVNINYGYTRHSIKVKSQSGNVRTYTITFGRDGEAGSGEDVQIKSDKATLESLELSEGTIDFDPFTFDYNVSVPYKVTNIEVTAKPKNKNDDVVVNGGGNLEIDALNEISIVVTSEDGEATNVYTIYVTRKEEDLPISSNSLLSDLYIEGYKIKFDAKTKEYSISAKEGTKELNITATPADSKSTITIEGNENLTNGSKIKIRVTAENGTYTDYFIETKIVSKGGNVVLTVIVIILIIAVLAYLVLRAMGYKLYFNLDGIKDTLSKLRKKK